ncbi:hypothetical protein ES319_D11G381100v1 [Gossypium barbadense]|uniref:Uncharacterized protein n=1 Tax=Gossypium barbadense TaxID=3634 RepID=A0A5J5PKL0_GOSBA|nr:hypothetical protein ES319_D11G381100v1 [Gossypium barbadense]
MKDELLLPWKLMDGRLHQICFSSYSCILGPKWQRTHLSTQREQDQKWLDANPNISHFQSSILAFSAFSW